MPSDDPRLAPVLAALTQPIAEFRAALAGALAQAEAVLADTGGAGEDRTERAAAGLGQFAAGRIRAERFAELITAPGVADGASRVALERAIAILRHLVERGTDALVVNLPTGGDLATEIGTALEQIGRGFGAATLAELVRGGRYRATSHDALLEASSYRQWNRAERSLTPPLVVQLDGADLNAAALAGFCDGHTRLVLLVRGACAPAPLVRLITPGTLVLQTTEIGELESLAHWDGPSVAALVPEGAARFRHDPAGGAEPWQRLSVQSLPKPPRKAVGGTSPWQMAEDLKQLETLARLPFTLPAAEGKAEGASGNAAVVERLEAWLLQ